MKKLYKEVWSLEHMETFEAGQNPSRFEIAGFTVANSRIWGRNTEHFSLFGTVLLGGYFSQPYGPGRVGAVK